MILLSAEQAFRLPRMDVRNGGDKRFDRLRP
jgi:hypothetical protein